MTGTDAGYPSRATADRADSAVRAGRWQLRTASSSAAAAILTSAMWLPRVSGDRFEGET